MRGTARVSLLAVACGIGSAANAQIVTRPGPVSGRVIAAKGGEQARLVPAAQWQRVERGQELKQGDLIRTNPTGTLALLFADRTQVRLGPNATMAVNAVARGAPSQVTLSAGKAWGRSPSGQTNLSVRTPSATAAIRGTEWAISADEDTTTLEVFDGQVELSNEFGSIQVNSGEAARVRRGQAPVKVTITNPEGREQMLYFVRADEALAMMESDDPRFTQARGHVDRGEWERAATEFAALRASPDAATRAAGAYGAYVAAIQLGQAQSVPTGDDEPNAVLGRALGAAYAGDLREALAIVDAGLARFPDNRGLYRAKARIGFLLGQRDTANAAIDAGLARFPGDPDLLGLKAEYLADYAGSPKAALVIARQAAAAKPGDADLEALLARIWLQLDGLVEARRAVDRALVARPQDAALMALRAEILLAQNETGAARRSLDAAIALEPDLSIVRLDMAEIYNRTGQREQALEEALAASAANPSFGRGFVTLAELSYDDAQPQVALQQLDAADRLDPYGPSVPLARTAIALHRFDADGAIMGARDALARQRGRGGEYSNLSENQQSGSLVSQSFRFLNLEGWGRYYGDRAFDSFSPVSYPDQVINRTASPFLIRSLDGSFDAFGGTDPDYISSYLQGAVQAPLSVINADKDLLFSRRNFFEASAGGAYLTESRREGFEGEAQASGLVNGAVPFGYNITLTGRRFDDSLPQVDLTPEVNQRRRDERVLQGLFGAELSPRNKLVAIVRDYRGSEASSYDNGLGMLPDRGPGRFSVYDFEAQETSAALFWEHELGYRNAITIGGLYSRVRNPGVLDLPVEGVFRADFEDKVERLLLSANYARSFGPLDLRTGVELSRYDFRSRSLLQTDSIGGFLDASDCEFEPELCEALGFDGELFNFPGSEATRFEDVRPYLDFRVEVGDWMILQGQGSYLRRTISDRRDPADPDFLPPETREAFDYQVGAAIEPVVGQWFRAAAISRTTTDQDFTFAPIAAVGLRGTITPAAEGARVSSYVARWDAEWLPQLFTSVEVQHQDFEALSYKVPSTEISITGGAAELDRISAEANLWLKGNVGIRVAYSYTDARARDYYVSSAFNQLADYGAEFEPGDRLPYVPRDTGQLALTWAKAAPLRARVELSLDYLGNQIGGDGEPLPGYVLANVRAQAEPFQRRLRIEAALLNLFDRRYVEGAGIAGPGITGRVAATVRF